MMQQEQVKRIKQAERRCAEEYLPEYEIERLRVGWISREISRRRDTKVFADCKEGGRVVFTLPTLRSMARRLKWETATASPNRTGRKGVSSSARTQIAAEFSRLIAGGLGVSAAARELAKREWRREDGATVRLSPDRISEIASKEGERGYEFWERHVYLGGLPE